MGTKTNPVSRAAVSTKRGRLQAPPASTGASAQEAPSPLEPWHGDRALARDEAEARLPLSLPEQIADRVCERIMRGDFAALNERIKQFEHFDDDESFSRTCCHPKAYAVDEVMIGDFRITDRVKGIQQGIIIPLFAEA